MKRFLPLLILLFAQSLWAEVVISPPTWPVQPGTLVVIPVTGLTDAQLATAQVTCTPQPPLLFPAKSWTGQSVILFQTSTPGHYQISISLNSWTAGLDEVIISATAAKVDAALLTKLTALNAEVEETYPEVNAFADLEVSGTVPPPPPPPPPLTDAPWESPGLSVLILHESQTPGTLPITQRAIFTSAKVQQWLTANTVKLPDGRPGYRIWDDDGSDVSAAPVIMQKAYKAVLPKMSNNEPTIGISNGKAGIICPLPTSIDALIALLEKYKI